jgi:hypothetical protein
MTSKISRVEAYRHRLNSAPFTVKPQVLTIISVKNEITSAIRTELTFEAWILCSSPDQRHRARLHERQEQILLGFREAMYLIYRIKFRTIQLNVTTSTPQAVSHEMRRTQDQMLTDEQDRAPPE